MKKTFAALAVIALAAIGAIAMPSAAFATGTISGAITNSASVGIPNATLEFQEPDGRRWLYTDAAGNFTGSLPNGTYTVYISAPGYAPEYFDNSYSVAGSSALTVVDGSTIVLNATLEAESTISGHITSYSSAGVAAQVYAFSANDTNGHVFYTSTLPATGEYTLHDLSPGTYKVYVSTSSSDDLVDEWYNNSFTQASATPVTISATGTATTVDVQLQQGGQVKGSVLNTIGSPLDVSVEAHGTSGATNPDANPDFDGNYVLNGLLPDTYSVVAHDYSGFFQESTSSPLTVTTATPSTANFVLTPTLVDESEFYPFPALSGPTTVQAGGTYTWTVDVSGDSDVYAIIYPNPVFLGAAVQDNFGVATLTLTIPADTTVGAHKLTYSSYDDNTGDARYYFDLTVTAADPSNPAAPGTGANLAATGLDSSLTLGSAALLLVLGTAFVVARRFVLR